jgi:hypothetical protein
MIKNLRHSNQHHVILRTLISQVEISEFDTNVN